MITTSTHSSAMKDMFSNCKGYEECKNKWYFEDLPKEVASAVKIVDHAGHPVETWERDELVRLADKFSKERGLPSERRAALANEMLALRAGRFDSLYLPSDPVQEATTFMYVPSVSYFVPYWHP
jgi:hypothetical protein